MSLSVQDCNAKCSKDNALFDLNALFQMPTYTIAASRGVQHDAIKTQHMGATSSVDMLLACH